MQRRRAHAAQSEGDPGDDIGRRVRPGPQRRPGGAERPGPRAAPGLLHPAAVYERADEYHTSCILPRGEAGPDALLRLGLNYVRFGHEERHLFRFLFESNRFGGMDLRGLMQGPGIGELVDILSQGLCCERAEAERVFLAFFAVVHGLGSLLCNNAMAYDETRCTEMLETVFYGALASLKGDNHA